MMSTAEGNRIGRHCELPPPGIWGPFGQLAEQEAALPLFPHFTPLDSERTQGGAEVGSPGPHPVAQQALKPTCGAVRRGQVCNELPISPRLSVMAKGRFPAPLQGSRILGRTC